MSWLSSLVTGGIGGNIERIASEWIETKQETEEAKTIMIKALDPNGLMRRDISRTVSRLYTVYIVITAILIMFQAFDISTIVMIDSVEHRSVDLAVTSLTDLFTEITALFGAIVTASFGVNGLNSYKGK